jgi:hypothetical protein
MSICDALDLAEAIADDLVRFQHLALRGNPQEATAALNSACRAAFGFKGRMQRARTILAATAPVGPQRDPYRYQPANDHTPPPSEPTPSIA